MTDADARALEARIADLEAELDRERRISRSLRRVGVAMGRVSHLDDLLELILDELTSLLDADRATLYLMSADRRALVSRVVVGDQVQAIRLDVSRGIAGLVARTGQPARLEDAYQDPSFDPTWDRLTGYQTRSMVAAPLRNHDGETNGVIQVLNKRAGVFTREDELMLETLGAQAAVAVDLSSMVLDIRNTNQQLAATKEQLEQRLSDMVLLLDLERATARAPDEPSLALAVLALMRQACGARGASLLLAEEDTGDLVQYVHPGGESAELRRLGVKSGEGALARVMQSGETLEAAEDLGALRHPGVEDTFAFPAESALIVPIEFGRNRLGALGVFDKQLRSGFDARDSTLLRLVGANVASALELLRANDRRVRTERLTSIGRLLSQVLHDFKSPLTVISGYVQLMQQEPDEATRRRYAAEALKQFDALGAMQREVLEFARGEKKLFVRRVYLGKFFAELRADIERLAAASGVEVRVTADTRAVARFDEMNMARAIHNMARNAIEAMPRGGVLTLDARLRGEELVIEVSDTGTGIPEEIRGRLFQSFVTAGKQGGTGLGLSIVKKIVDDHGGSIDVRSGPGGATFTLRIPQPSDSEGGRGAGAAPRAQRQSSEGAPRASARSREPELVAESSDAGDT